MRGETADQFRDRMMEKAAQQRHFIALEEAAAVAAVEARRSPRERKAAVASAQRRASSRVIRSKAEAVADASRAHRGEQERRRRSRTVGPGRSGPRESQRTVPERCLSCDRTLRTNYREGEVRHYGRGLCTSCATRSPNGPREAAYPCTCRGTCGRTLRSSSSSLEDFPGTVKAVRPGLCGACARGGKPRPRGAGVVFECRGGCGRMTRPGAWPADRAPGSVVRLRDGKCRRCLNQEARWTSDPE